MKLIPALELCSVGSGNSFTGRALQLDPRCCGGDTALNPKPALTSLMLLSNFCHQLHLNRQLAAEFAYTIVAMVLSSALTK